MCGIYQITAPSGNFYIGSSSNIKGRFRQHRHALIHGRHDNSALQRACNKYGIQNLVFSVVHIVLDANLLPVIEQKFINHLRPEYNMAEVVGFPMLDKRIAAKMGATARTSERHIKARLINQKLAAAAVSKPVVRLTDGTVFPSSYAAARAMNTVKSQDQLSAAIAKGWKYAGHFWKFLSDRRTLEEIASAHADREARRVASAISGMIASVGRSVRCVETGESYKTIADAERAIGRSGLSRALSEGFRCDGRRWEYAVS